MFIISAITGLTLPGIIDEPGCTGRRAISASPVVGPDASNLRLFMIRDSSIAKFLNAALKSTNGARDRIAQK